MQNTKVVLITGASSGIGKATAEKLVADGHQVILNARSKDKLDKIVNDLGGDCAYAIPADAGDFTALDNAVKSGIKHFGRLDAVFANAGMGVTQAGIENGEPEQWNKMIDVNVKALIYTAKICLPYLKETQGHFIITGSVAGRIALKGSIYGATKWFAYGFGQNLAAEMSEWKGRCTTICPGMVNTPFFDEPKPDKLSPTDIADAVLYALSTHQRCNIREVYLMPTA